MSNPIEWEEKVETTRRVCLRVISSEGHFRPATLDDLRKACEAVGLHSLLLAQLSAAEARTTSQACSRVATETRAVGLMAENGELRSALRQALNVGLAECERLRGEVNSAVHETDMRRAWAIDPLRQPGESRADCVRRLATERDAAIARAEKAEALHSKAEAEVSCRNEMRARIAELETALANTERGIGFGEAGPAVYAANARHDEAAREWEDERAELVRTRQETQDKLSEARKELHDLRTKLAALTAPVEGEPSIGNIMDAWSQFRHSGPEGIVANALSQWRAGHAAGLAVATRDAEAAAKDAAVQAIHAPRDLPRATDEELVRIGEDAYEKRWEMGIGAEARPYGYRAVADRVRREQCLVTRAVEMGVDLHIEVDDSGSVWVIEAVDRTGSSREIEVDSPSDVARVLAEMLGEVK